MNKLKNVSRLYSQTLVATCFVIALTFANSQLIAGAKTDKSTLHTNDEWPSGKPKISYWNIRGNRKNAKVYDWQISGHKKAKSYVWTLSGSHYDACTACSLANGVYDWQ
jgi:hypothetical protein